MPFTDKEVQDKYKEYLDWKQHADRNYRAMLDEQARWERNYKLSIRFKEEHAQMVKENRKERK